MLTERTVYLILAGEFAPVGPTGWTSKLADAAHWPTREAAEAALAGMREAAAGDRFARIHSGRVEPYRAIVTV